MNALTVSHLSKSFKIPHLKTNSLVELLSHPKQDARADTLQVLRDVSFSVEQGETVGVIGANGSGKSTLLKIISSIYLPDSGTIKSSGRIVPFLELGVGFNPELTARENIFLNGIILGMKRSFLEKKFNDILEFAELERFVDLPLKNFSSGMQVRLAFSIAFTAEADIYLLDEVFSVGDISFQQKSRAVFEKLKKEGKTLLLVSHSQPIIESYCERVLLVKDGTVTSYDNVAEGIGEYNRTIG